MLSLDAAIALGGGKQPINERRPSSFCSKTGVDPSPDGGGGGVYVKYWPSGGWALAHTGALTRENTVYI